MSRIFLDTSAYSAFKRGRPQIRHRIREASEIHVNPIVLGELRAGYLKSTTRGEPASSQDTILTHTFSGTALAMVASLATHRNKLGLKPTLLLRALRVRTDSLRVRKRRDILTSSL